MKILIALVFMVTFCGRAYAVEYITDKQKLEALIDAYCAEDHALRAWDREIDKERTRYTQLLCGDSTK